MKLTAQEVRDTLEGMKGISGVNDSEVQALIDDPDFAQEFAEQHPDLHGFALADRLSEQVESA